MSDGEGNENGGNKHERKYKPYRFSGKNHSFDGQVEKVIVDQIRAWAYSYLNENTVIHKSSYTPLRDVRTNTEKRDIDLLVKIMRVFERDEINYELKIKDLSGDSSWIMTVNKLKFSEFNPGEIYRIRSVVAEKTTERNVITCKSTTNILRFSKDSLIYRELDVDVKQDVEENPDQLLMNPVMTTRVTTEDPLNSKKVKFYRLQDLFTDYDSLSAEEKQLNQFRVQIQVLKIDPVDLRDCAVAMC